MDQPPPLPPRNLGWRMILGMVVANAVGAALVLGLTLFLGAYRNRDLLALVAWPSFVLVPLFVGLVAAWFWRRLQRSIAWSALDALCVSFVGIGAAALILREGVVCLVLVFSPSFTSLFSREYSSVVFGSGRMTPSSGSPSSRFLRFLLSANPSLTPKKKRA